MVNTIKINFSHFMGVRCSSIPYWRYLNTKLFFSATTRHALLLNDYES